MPDHDTPTPPASGGRTTAGLTAAREAAEALVREWRNQPGDEIVAGWISDQQHDALVNRVVRFGAAREAAGREAAARIVTPVPCGSNPVLPAERVGCGQMLAHEPTVYRCADCSVPFHRDCLRRHVGAHPAPAGDAPAAGGGARWLTRELARLLCETGKARDPRFPTTTVSVEEVSARGDRPFTAEARDLTDEEAAAIVESYRAARRAGEGA